VALRRPAMDEMQRGSTGVARSSLAEENRARGGKTWARRQSLLLKGGVGVEQ
jgi:hypothetical protein